jgi:predicted DNA-binding protein
MANPYSATRTIRIAQEKDQRMLAVCDRLGKSPNRLLNEALDRYLEAIEGSPQAGECRASKQGDLR